MNDGAARFSQLAFGRSLLAICQVLRISANGQEPKANCSCSTLRLPLLRGVDSELCEEDGVCIFNITTSSSFLLA